MALTVPLDTTRTRLILDEKLKSKKTTEVLLHLLKEEGV